MSLSLYVRIRGRIHGPLDIAKLKDLVRKGQLSRIHEISTDRVNWQPASSVPELFQGVSVPAATPAEQVSAGTSQAVASDGAGPSPSRGSSSGEASEEEWYYAIDGAQHGPILRGELIQMIRAGNLRRIDMVWKHGMEQWVAAERCAELVGHFQSSGSEASGRTEGASQSLSGAKGTPLSVLTRSKTWIRIVMIGAFTLGALNVVFGLFGVITSIVASSMFGLMSGLVVLVYAALFLWIGAAFVQLTGSIRIAEATRSSSSLTDAISKARMGWMALGVLFSFTIFNVILAIIIMGVAAMLEGEMVSNRFPTF